MTSLADYSKTIHDWCVEVESTAIELFKSGVHVQQCTGIAINIVEARRTKTAEDRARLAVQPVRGIPRA